MSHRQSTLVSDLGTDFWHPGGVIIAEDGEGLQHLVGATVEGATYPLARNDFTDKSKNVEFTGPVYSPDKKLLFANIQEPGYMFAISGPWRIQA